MAAGSGTLRLDCQALNPELAGLIRPLLMEAAGSLELAAHFFSFTLVVDDLPGVGEAPVPWLHLAEGRKREGRQPEDGLPQEGPNWHGELFCAETHFLEGAVADAGLLPGPEIWDAVLRPVEAEPTEAGPIGGTFREAAARRLLHHELLTARDWARRELVGAAIPRQAVESFAVVWAVTVDGRLHRLGLPGYSMAERRNRFSRHFSSAGVLLPDHWEIFQSLWDGAVAGWPDVLALLRHLPGSS
ncbi:hypothetical protein CSB20_09835 [bacterium DOLZORAL124_64_63]|nr:MAG: hypothetical protein CSB20_09835 [bacterium DOLZORAL124_64_63]